MSENFIDVVNDGETIQTLTDAEIHSALGGMVDEVIINISVANSGDDIQRCIGHIEFLNVDLDKPKLLLVNAACNEFIVKLKDLGVNWSWSPHESPELIDLPRYMK